MGLQFRTAKIEVEDALAQAAMQIEVLENKVLDLQIKNSHLQVDLALEQLKCMFRTPALDLVAAENAKLKLEVAALKKEIEDRNAARSKVNWKDIFHVLRHRPKPEHFAQAIFDFGNLQYKKGAKDGWIRGSQGRRP
jgi:hypothetical protein